MIDHPKVISIALPDHKQIPFAGKSSVKIINKILSENFKGTVKDNQLVDIVHPLWVLQKLGEGHYKIIHNLGLTNISLSISLLEQPGSFELKEHSPTCFQVVTMLDKTSKDLDFMFSITRVISPQA